MKKQTPAAAPAPITWQRAHPAQLAAFDPRTKRCSMNCGPHRDDPRSDLERLFLCDECYAIPVQKGSAA